MQNEIKVGIIVVVGIVLLMVFIGLVGNIDFGSKGYAIVVKFKRINNLNVGAPVIVAGGKNIGSVQDIDIGGGYVRLTLLIDAEEALYESQPFRLSTLGLMGDSYIDVGLVQHAEGDEKLKDGDEILGTDPLDIGVLDNLDKSGEDIINDIIQLIGNLSAASADVQEILSESRGNLPSSIRNLNLMTYRMADGLSDDSLKNSLVSMDHAFRDLRYITAQIRSKKGTMGKVIYDDSLYNNLNTALIEVTGAAERIRKQGVLGKEKK